ncbi:fimbrial protein [Proteus alimentorum]|uniref:fimbrial protein n=1 Tax=Proteus alimentorum TaxID=1973495 RepID=UPI000BFFC5E1|nr:fimbrial protein [Proteus alimentorum]
MRVLISIILLCFSGLSFAECKPANGSRIVSVSKEFHTSRAAGIKKDGLVYQYIISSKANLLECTAGSKIYLSVHNDEKFAPSGLQGEYGRIDGKIAYNFTSNYAFTVDDVETGQEVPKYPSYREITVDHDGLYTPPSIKVSVYATNDGESISSSSVIPYTYVSYLQNEQQKSSKPTPSNNNAIVTYMTNGLISAPPTTCRIQNGKNILQLNLPRVAHSSFPEKGFTQDSNGVAEDYFDIQCSGSATGLVYITTQYEHYENVTLNSKAASVFKSQNEGQDGNAKGVGIIISAESDFSTGFVANNADPLISAGKEKKVTLYAKYYRYADDYTPGKISGSINFDLEVR